MNGLSHKYSGYFNSIIPVKIIRNTTHVTLRANIESGIPPLTTYFSVSTEIPNAVTTYGFDAEGDGTMSTSDLLTSEMHLVTKYDNNSNG